MKKTLILLILASSLFTNAQNVGIGTNSPASKLTLDGNNPDIGFMNNGLAHGFIKASGSDFIISTAPDNPIGKLILGTKDNSHFSIDNTGKINIGTTSTFDALVKLGGTSPSIALLYQNIQKGFFGLNGNDIRIGTYNGNGGNIVFTPKGVDKIWINEYGELGIGTDNPVSLLTINGTNPYIQMQHGGVSKGFVQALGNDLKVGTNSTNTTGNLVLQTKLLDRMTIDENGQVGIGTTTPTSILSINSSNPIIQLKNSGTDKGFVQLVNDDIKIGTNISNASGKFIIRTAGSDRLEVDGNGNVKSYGGIEIETASPGILLNGTTGNSFITFDDNTKHLTIQKTNLGAGGRLIMRADGGLSTTSLNITTSGLMNFGSGLNPATYKFSVEGKIIATDFTALPVASWPDYVFANNYELRPLSEVKKFIEQNKHLPNIPSAAQIEKEGIQLGDISKRLMEKVEELALYILQQQEQLDALKKKVEEKR